MHRQIPTVNTNILVGDCLSGESSAICQGCAELPSCAERGGRGRHRFQPRGAGGGQPPGFCTEKCAFGSKQRILEVYSDFTEILWLPSSLKNIPNLWEYYSPLLYALPPASCWDGARLPSCLGALNHQGTFLHQEKPFSRGSFLLPALTLFLWGKEPSQTHWEPPGAWAALRTLRVVLVRGAMPPLVINSSLSQWLSS